MPAYVYRCPLCRRTEYLLRSVEKRNDPCPCCGHHMQRLIQPPAIHSWNADRRFPNLSPEGDGTKSFASRAAYETHLKDLGLAESSHTAPVKRPHGNRVVRTVKL